MASSKTFIPVYRPNLSGNEERYVLDCVRSSWISSIGAYVDKFEQEFARYTGFKHAIAVSNGTVALHLAFHALGIGPGDEVIVPTFTYIASVNTIAQTGAKPVFVDCLPDTWLLDPEDVKRKITPRTKAICVVHLYGVLADTAAVAAIARDHGIPVVEDCAEAFGSTENGVHAGHMGIVSTFSFFGNKTITTGEGGMVVSNDSTLAAHMRKLKGQGQSLTRRYWHDELGFNYRMTNICAAIGLAQIERIDAILARKIAIGERYAEELTPAGCSFQRLRPGMRSSYWLASLLLPDGVDRDTVMKLMAEDGVETRPVFFCASDMPMYADGTVYPVSAALSRRGISLPSFPDITDEEQATVIRSLRNALAAVSTAAL